MVIGNKKHITQSIILKVNSLGGDSNSSGYLTSPSAVNQQAGPQGRSVLCSTAVAAGGAALAFGAGGSTTAARVSLGGAVCNA